MNINPNRKLLVGSLLLLAAMSQSTPSLASGSLVVRDGGYHGRYTEVFVGSDRYYYDRGIYYTGGPGRYVVVEAPVGAVIYNPHVRYEQVHMNGERYYRAHNAYYRHNGRGYEVVRVNESYDQGHNRGNGNGRSNGHKGR